jgi:predicted small metal-binding protein
MQYTRGSWVFNCKGGTAADFEKEVAREMLKIVRFIRKMQEINE